MLFIILTLFSLIAALFFYIVFFAVNREVNTNKLAFTKWDYNKLKTMIQVEEIQLPAMIVDLDIFDSNAKRLIDTVRQSGKSLRVATKSIRSVELIKRLQSLGGDIITSFMTFSVQETQLLSEHGLDDFFVPYPSVQQCDIDLALDLTQKGKVICLTVDSVDHIERLDELCSCYYHSKQITSPAKLRVAIDLDMSYRPLGGVVSLGPHRSALNSVMKVDDVLDKISKSKHMKLVGVIGYEAHVAGLPDDNPYTPFLNPAIRWLKGYFLQSAINFHREIHKLCKDRSVNLEFVNGGGSGDIREACEISSLTEVTAGSAFLQSQMFDYFTNNKSECAFCFALQATRIGQEYICCQSGGFVASGSCSEDKFPRPFANPLQLTHYKDEGYGEVQTPLKIISKVPQNIINLGDPIFFRPAKAGEIAEHFTHYYTKSGYTITGQIQTYRGMGHVFY